MVKIALFWEIWKLDVFSPLSWLETENVLKWNIPIFPLPQMFKLLRNVEEWKGEKEEGEEEVPRQQKQKEKKR